MLKRYITPLILATLVLASAARAQTKPVQVKEPTSNGQTLTEWIKDLKALAPHSRNAAAYEIAGMGPEAARAVPALIEALEDPSPAVRFPVTVALREIGPAAAAAVPALRRGVGEKNNDENA